MTKNEDKSLQKRLWWKMPLAILKCVFLLLLLTVGLTTYAQQASQTQVTSYNWSQSSGTYVPVS